MDALATYRWHICILQNTLTLAKFKIVGKLTDKFLNGSVRIRAL